MAHSHLGLKLACGLKCDTDNDEQRRTTECKRTEISSCEDIDKERKPRNERKEYCADKSDSVEYHLDIIGSGFTRTDTGDESAVLLQIVGNLNVVEADLNIEVREGDDQCNEEQNVHDRAR